MLCVPVVSSRRKQVKAVWGEAQRVHRPRMSARKVGCSAGVRAGVIGGHVKKKRRIEAKKRPNWSVEKARGRAMHSAMLPNKDLS